MGHATSSPDPVAVDLDPETQSRRGGQDAARQWASGQLVTTATSSGHLVVVKAADQVVQRSLCEGERVRIVGIKGRPELNGLFGMLCGYNAPAGRWHVEVLDQLFRLKPACLERVKSPTFGEQEAEWLQLCRSAVPSWRELDNEIELAADWFDEGTHSLVRQVELRGPGAKDISPTRCVYTRCPARTHELQQAFNTLAVEAGEAGLAPRLFAAVGSHRVMEYFEGVRLFGGGQAHFLSTFGMDQPLRSRAAASDPLIMEAVGRTVGRLHRMPLDWMARGAGEEELQRRLASPAFFPRYVMSGIFMASPDMREGLARMQASPAIPHSDLFAQPVTMHGDLHGGNILINLDDDDYPVRLVDWEMLTIGHRGADLAYFLLNAHGSTVASRRAFASAYLAAARAGRDDGCAKGEPEAEAVDKFLVDVERCMPLGLASMASLACIFTPHLVPILLHFTFHSVDVLEKGGVAAEQLLQVGLVRTLRDCPWL